MKINEILIRILRKPRTRGFGVQSPFAYQFIRYVIDERYPYYAYDDLKRVHPDYDTVIVDTGELFFRIANFWQPDVVYGFPDCFADYIKAGCNKTLFINNSEYSLSLRKVIYLESSSDIDVVIEKCNENTMLIVSGINIDKALWNFLVKDKRTGVSFDLFSYGIIFFDKNKTKQNYRVNF